MLSKFWDGIVSAFSPPAAVVAEPEPAPLPDPEPVAIAKPDLDFEQPDEAFEVLRRVAKAAETKSRYVVVSKGRVPPHQRHLVSRVDLERYGASELPRPLVPGE